MQRKLKNEHKKVLNRIRQRVGEMADEKGLTGDKYAKVSGRSKNTLTKFTGTRDRDIFYSTLLEFADALEVSVPELLGYPDYTALLAELRTLREQLQDRSR